MESTIVQECRRQNAEVEIKNAEVRGQIAEVSTIG
jgi:hypothetical protein